MTYKQLLQGLKMLWAHDGVLNDQANLENLIDTAGSLRLEGALELYVKMMTEVSKKRRETNPTFTYSAIIPPNDPRRKGKGNKWHKKVPKWLGKGK